MVLENTCYRAGIAIRNFTSPQFDFGSSVLSGMPISLAGHFEYLIGFKNAKKTTYLKPQLIANRQKGSSFGQVGLSFERKKILIGYHLHKGIKSHNQSENFLESIAVLGMNLNNLHFRYSLGLIHNSNLKFINHSLGLSFTPLIKTPFFPYHNGGNPVF